MMKPTTLPAGTLALLTALCLPTTLQAHHTPSPHEHGPDGEPIYMMNPAEAKPETANASAKSVTPASAVDSMDVMRREAVAKPGETQESDQHSGR